MISRILNKQMLFSLLAVSVLGAGMAVSADKAGKPAKSCAACCMQKQKARAPKTTAAKTATAKAKSGKPAAAKAAPAKAPAARNAAKKMTPAAGGAGWIYREPGSPMPQSPITRGAIVPRIQAAKDPKNGVSMTLPPMTASVATVDAKGHVDCACESGAGHSHADKKQK